MIEVITAVTAEVEEALSRLLAQLGGDRTLAAAKLEAVVASPDAQLFVLRDDSGRIVATATVSFLLRLNGRRAWIEDVVVDEGSRRLGYGRAIVQAAVDAARAGGAYSTRLTSAAHRAEAHAMYEAMGFRRRDTRVYEIA